MNPIVCCFEPSGNIKITVLHCVTAAFLGLFHQSDFSYLGVFLNCIFREYLRCLIHTVKCEGC